MRGRGDDCDELTDPNKRAEDEGARDREPDEGAPGGEESLEAAPDEDGDAENEDEGEDEGEPPGDERGGEPEGVLEVPEVAAAAVVPAAVEAPAIAATPAAAVWPKRRFTQPLVGCAAAVVCVIIAVWASLATSGPHAVVPAADSSGSAGGGAGAVATPTRSTPPPAPKTLAQTIASVFTIPGAPELAWPSRGQAAVDVIGMGSLGTYGSTSTPVPIASVTKTMVAYVVLSDYPLSPGESGPTITVSAAEAAAYPAEHALGQSLVQVRAGEHLTERQALEALMLASADNVAEILARWDTGSVSVFVAKMNAFAVKLGMAHTTYTDPSGYAPSTVSTAVDQMRLGEAAMQLSSFSSLVGESSATVPVQGRIGNYNKLIGSDGVTGVKTGSTDQAGGCLLFSATFTVGGKSVSIVGAVLGQYLGTGSGFLDNTLYVAQKLIRSAEDTVVSSTVVAPGTQVAAIRQAGAVDVPLGVSSAVSVVGLAGTTYQVSVSGDPSAATLTVTGTGGSSPTASAPLAQIVASSGTASPGTASSGTAPPGATSSAPTSVPSAEAVG
jgi:serine-type D-Ala-D-Ala carboxypeptidase (penicillin-binding protein 5/6)